MTASHIATLVLTAEPGMARLTPALAQAALDAASAAGARLVAAARWLAPGDAWEAALDIAAPDGLEALKGGVGRALGAAPVDVNVVSGDPDRRIKRLLTADMESTIIAEELIDEIAKLAGRHDEIAAITAAAMRGELDFAGSLRERVALLAGFPEPHLASLRARITPMPGAEILLRTLRANGVRMALVTGGFTYFAAHVADRFGFDAVAANVLEIENGRLTGRVREPILGPEGKAEALARLAAEAGIGLAETLAVGDGANDARMLAVAGLGVAFRAKPALATQAAAAPNGAVVRHGDLTALLHLMGTAPVP